MARAPDPRIKEAKAMYLKGVKLVEIASKLNLPEGTVRRWKSTHKWDNERSDKKSERSERKKGGQPGNRNAEGHGGTGPPGNKNAVRTGEFETLFFNTLNWEEQQLTSMIGLDEKPPPGMTVVKYTDGLEKGDCTELKEYAGILGQIQQIEDALTRVQAKKQKAIEAIHKFGYDDAKLELATMQLELQIMKQDGGSHETADDGFMDAMNATASEVWGDQDV